MAIMIHLGSPVFTKTHRCVMNPSQMNEGHRKAFPLRAELNCFLVPSKWLNIMWTLTVSWVSRSRVFNVCSCNTDPRSNIYTDFKQLFSFIVFFTFTITTGGMMILILCIGKVKKGLQQVSLTTKCGSQVSELVSKLSTELPSGEGYQMNIHPNYQIIFSKNKCRLPPHIWLMAILHHPGMLVSK